MIRPKLLWGRKDGGPDSKVYCWGIEIKDWFSVLLLKFEKGSREAFHSHAFNSVSWLLKGGLIEEEEARPGTTWTWSSYLPSIAPIYTYRTTVHKVSGVHDANWVLTCRGPWADTWRDISADGDLTLTHGRQEVK